MKYYVKEIPGKVHHNNGDSHYARVFKDNTGQEWGLFMVADGLSGFNETMASHKAVRLISDDLERRIYNNQSDVKESVSGSVSLANNSLKGARTTLDLVLISQKSAYLAHMGDSRVYFVYGSAVKQVTKDESNDHMPTNYLGEYVDAENILTRINFKELTKSDLPRRILLTTDGLVTRVTKDEIDTLLLSECDDPRDILDEFEHIVYEPHRMLSSLSGEMLRMRVLYDYFDVAKNVSKEKLIEDAMSLYLSGENIKFVKHIDTALKFDDTTMILIDLEDVVGKAFVFLRDYQDNKVPQLERERNSYKSQFEEKIKELNGKQSEISTLEETNRILQEKINEKTIFIRDYGSEMSEVGAQLKLSPPVIKGADLSDVDENVGDSDKEKFKRTSFYEKCKEVESCVVNGVKAVRNSIYKWMSKD